MKVSRARCSGHQGGRCSGQLSIGKLRSATIRSSEIEKHMASITLVVVSPLNAHVNADGSLTLTSKLVEGLRLFRKLWGGPVLHLCEPAQKPSHNLDNCNIDPKECDFTTVCGEFSEEFFKASIPRTSLVLTSVGEKFNSLSEICHSIGVPCVYVAEFTLRTRLQIAAEYQRGVLHGAWSKLRQVRQEMRQARSIQRAIGVQCNGLPTFDAYRRICNNAHLYFDSRIEESMMPSDQQLSSKLRSREARAVHLLFSGRLDRMKGVDDLPKIATLLRSRGVSFVMSICGDGECAPDLAGEIVARGLSDFVHLRGNLDFKSELVPLVIKEADLFVCCHRQGDPSCTYLETMSCGVPIAGYGNEAWAKLSRFSDTGWSSPSGDPDALAQLISGVVRQHGELERHSRRSLTFARSHTFEKTFARRVEHLINIANAYHVGPDSELVDHAKKVVV